MSETPFSRATVFIHPRTIHEPRNKIVFFSFSLAGNCEIVRRRSLVSPFRIFFSLFFTTPPNTTLCIKDAIDLKIRRISFRILNTAVASSTSSNQSMNPSGGGMPPPKGVVRHLNSPEFIKCLSSLSHIYLLGSFSPNTFLSLWIIQPDFACIIQTKPNFLGFYFFIRSSSKLKVSKE